jgi:hypothetical protein
MLSAMFFGNKNLGVAERRGPGTKWAAYDGQVEAFDVGTADQPIFMIVSYYASSRQGFPDTAR